LIRYHALAVDYDGTIAHDGGVYAATVAALERVKASGRNLLLVTGRELDDLLEVFPEVGIFDLVVGENGALLYEPSSREEQVLGPPVPEDFARTLHALGVTPLSKGRVIVATREPHETTVIEVIREKGLELQVIFNKGAVMVLPAGVNKATGLQAALSALGLSPRNLAGVGDAENDHAFLSICELSAAVANALAAVKERADVVTSGARGEGVQELIEELLRDDLKSLSLAINRHDLVVGRDKTGEEVRVPPAGKNLLLAGPSGGGKSTLAKGFLERLTEHGYQYCVIDPEGDYEDFEAGVVLGDRERVPKSEEVLQVLERTDQNAVVNLLGVALEQRPAFFAGALKDLLDMRSRTGRPHWLVLDEAQHLLPVSWEPARLALPQELVNVVMITHRPDQMASSALETVDSVFVVGTAPQETLHAFADAVGERPPRLQDKPLATGEGLLWERGARQTTRFDIAPTTFVHRRHRRKYAEGDLGAESFYFRGPGERLNLRAQNLALFVQLADGVDEETWEYHRQKKHYSKWFRQAIKDDDLANDAESIEMDPSLDCPDSRRAIREAIEKRYTVPSAAASAPPER
jgi:hydroxymethylpyrimidine pyrophosphatase-like HAD family hydrolase/energy-coupling factor transporter ATP-binding protein EcfA2